MSIGEQLKKKRLELGLSQIQVAEQCGLTYTSVLNAEKNKQISLNTLTRICNVLGLNVVLKD